MTAALQANPVMCPACRTDEPGRRCTCGAFIIALPPLDDILTINKERKVHWSVRNRIVESWRDGTAQIAKAARIPAMPRAHIYASWNPRTNIRKDPANAYPTIKACVDGLVLARVLPDDDAKHLDGPDMRLGPPARPLATVTLAVIPLPEQAAR